MPIASQLLDILAQNASENSGTSATITLFVVCSTLFVLLGSTAVYVSRVKKVGPNQAMIITGRPRPVLDPDSGQTNMVNYRIVTGGRAFIWPVIERVDVLSLELINVPIQVSAAHLPVKATASAQVKIGNDERAIMTAFNHLGNRNEQEIQTLAGDILTNHLHAALSQADAAQIHTERAALASQAQASAVKDLEKIGLEIFSLVITDVQK